jgi:Putative Actinobacterial Holin-X, holin superfamily III
MADQATVSRSDGVPIDAPATAVVSNVAEFGNDFATLAELQAKLAVIDLKESTGRAALPGGVLAAALVLLLGSVPVLLAGAAELLVRYTTIGRGWALLLTAVVALVLAVVIGALAAARLARSFASFQRSQEELTRNVAWIKTVLTYSGRSAPSQRRRV